MPRRRGVVLLAVLLVVVVLSLAAYQYSQWITAEDTAANAYARMVQARAFAESGVNYAAVMLSNSSVMSGTLNGNPWDNPQSFQNVMVPSAGNGPSGMFSIVGLVNPDDPNQMSQAYRFGVIDEAGKINVNALLALDNGKGDVGVQVLMALPNMTEDVANSILDWLDPDDTPRTDGAEEDYYTTLDPPYHCKNGPLDSLEELLLVKGVTPELLYGNDLNRNGVLDPNEDDGSGAVGMGWSAYLTVYSREPNTDVNGNARVYLNDSDLNFLSDQLTTALGEDLANYIIAYRLYGPASTTVNAITVTPAGQRPTTRTAAFTPLSGGDVDRVRTTLRTARASPSGQPKQVSSLWDLVDSSVSIPGSGPGAQAITMQSPLSDPGQQAQLLPLLLDETTTTQNTDLTPKVNINTASQTVLQAVLAALTNPSANSTATSTSQDPNSANAPDDTDIQTILSTRPDPTVTDSAPDPIFQTPAWLLTQANLPLAKVKALAPYITTRSQVYRFQSVGYFEGGVGPAARIEAVVDGNNGRPRIVYHRDLGTLGAGFDLGQIAAGQ